MSEKTRMAALLVVLFVAVPAALYAALLYYFGADAFLTDLVLSAWFLIGVFLFVFAIPFAFPEFYERHGNVVVRFWRPRHRWGRYGSRYPYYGSYAPRDPDYYRHAAEDRLEIEMRAEYSRPADLSDPDVIRKYTSRQITVDTAEDRHPYEEPHIIVHPDMRVCPSCGTPNAGTETQCTVCATHLA